MKSSISFIGEVIYDDIPDLADDLALLALFSETSSFAAQHQLFRVLELMWSENSLRLYACDFAFLLADASRQANRYE